MLGTTHQFLSKKLFYLSTLVFVILTVSASSSAQDLLPIALYRVVPNSIPAPVGYAENPEKDKVTMVTEPTITPFFPEKGKANGSAVLICPGGAYRFLALEHEGNDVAKKFNEIGITAFVLKYRLPSNKIMIDKSIGPLQDAQRGIQIIRQRSKEWGVNPEKVGIVGFSAGGHLASTAGTHYDKAVIDNQEAVNLRPDFMILLYPVITFGEKTHLGSRNNLLGKDTTEAMLNLYSNEKQVTANTPPTFLMQSENDQTVPVQNSLLFYQALLKFGVKTEMHLYQAGGHGFGLNNRSTSDYWFDRCKAWLKQNGF